MITLSNANNEKKLSQVEAELAGMLKEILRRGFYGTAGVEVSVQDGMIQHVRSRMEKIVR
jgi:hypothetical protein